MKITSALHEHTHLSLCAVASATAEAYINNARRLGLKRIGIADHMWDTEHIPLRLKPEDYTEQAFSWMQGYNKENYTYTTASKPEFNAVEHSDIEVLFGCECEYDPVRLDIAITKEVADKLDFLVVPHSHTHLIMPKKYLESTRSHAVFTVMSFMDIVNSPLSGYITAIAHPFSTNDKGVFDAVSDTEYRVCFNAAAKKGIAIEINTSTVEDYIKSDYANGGLANSGLIRMFRIAKDCGCKFTVGTDSHSADGQNNINLAYAVAGILELKDDDLADIMK